MKELWESKKETYRRIYSGFYVLVVSGVKDFPSLGFSMGTMEYVSETNGSREWVTLGDSGSFRRETKRVLAKQNKGERKRKGRVGGIDK